jgi:DNA-3-methyladenine glycosylase II
VDFLFQKINYIKNIAEFSLKGGLKPNLIAHLSDDEVIKHLTQIKGVGKWTAEMVLIFSLNRPDIFPIDDLVVRNATAELFSIKESKHYKKEILELSEQWKPHRTYVSLLVWKWKDLGISVDV